MTEETRMTAKQIALAAYAEKRDEEGRTRAEAAEERRLRHKRRMDHVLGQIGRHAGYLKNPPPLAEHFPEEHWEVVDLEPVFDGRAYGTCQPDVVITDQESSFFLGVTLTCSGQHHWWVDPVVTATGPCHWRIRDKQGEANPRPLQIGEWLEGLTPEDRRQHSRLHLRERLRTFE